MKANYEDHKNDCIITSINLLAIILGKFGIYFVDGIVGFSIAVWIMKNWN